MLWISFTRQICFVYRLLPLSASNHIGSTWFILSIIAPIKAAGSCSFHYPHRIARWRKTWAVKSVTTAYSVTRFPTLLGCCSALPPLKIPCGAQAVQKQRTDYLPFPYALYIHTEINVNIQQSVENLSVNSEDILPLKTLAHINV